MNKIRKLPLVILVALVCSSVCWSQNIVSQRASEKTDLSVNTSDAHLQVGTATEIEDMRAARKAISTRKFLRILGSTSSPMDSCRTDPICRPRELRFCPPKLNSPNHDRAWSVSGVDCRAVVGDSKLGEPEGAKVVPSGA